MTPVHTTALAPAAEVDAALRGPLAPECGLPAELPPAEREVRLAYYHQKKVPQLRWMLHQAKELLEARAAADGRRAAPPLAPQPARPPAPLPLVVDLGCGKGDFTLLFGGAAFSSRWASTRTHAIKYAETRLGCRLRNVRFKWRMQQAHGQWTESSASADSGTDGEQTMVLRYWWRFTHAAASQTWPFASRPRVAPRASSAHAASASIAR